MNTIVSNQPSNVEDACKMLARLTVVVLAALAVCISGHDADSNGAAPTTFRELFRSNGVPVEETPTNVFILFGASGDLAKKKLYPALWVLFRDNLLPNNTIFYGYARTKMTVDELRTKISPFIQVKPEEQAKYDEFWKVNHYFAGGYDTVVDVAKFNEELAQYGRSNRLFYLALPASVFEPISEIIKGSLMSLTGWNRLIVEKPFGKDAESSKNLNDHLARFFTEDQIYRIDHYLGKEMVQNLLALRFGNRMFSPAWNRENIASVLIQLKEPFGTGGRGGYFDEFGIIRDVIQNHLLQVLSIIAMEKPVSSQANDIRDEKVKVLKSIPPILLEDTVLGQYVGNPNGVGDETMGYLDDTTVPANSTTATYALTVLRINNERWEGVPFMIRAGKATDEHSSEIRIQFRDVAGDIFGGQTKRDELVIRIRPGDAITAKVMIKSPGITSNIEQTQLNLTYAQQFPGIRIPEPYESMILDIFKGTQLKFVRTDELKEAWRIYTPLLHRIEAEKKRPISYVYGSHGPVEVGAMCEANNFKFHGQFD